MEEKAELFIHPMLRPEVRRGVEILGADTIYGVKVGLGDTLQENDFYASNTGKWEKCPCSGLVLLTKDVLWVRPVSK